MKATIRAELRAIGEIEMFNQDGSGHVTERGIFLEGATDDDVRAFAPLMCAGMVSLAIERMRPRDAIDMAAVRRIAAKIVRAAEAPDASVSAQTWAREFIQAGVGPHGRAAPREAATATTTIK